MSPRKKAFLWLGNACLLEEVLLADTFWLRLKGLLGRKEIFDQEGLLLLDCRAIHCFFMKCSIDAIYLNAQGEILHIETLQPWQLGAKVKGTAHILEMAAGRASHLGLHIGQHLTWNQGSA